MGDFRVVKVDQLKWKLTAVVAVVAVILLFIALRVPVAIFSARIDTEVLTGIFAYTVLENKIVWAIENGVICVTGDQQTHVSSNSPSVENMPAAKCPDDYWALPFERAGVSPAPCTNFRLERVEDGVLRIELSSEQDTGEQHPTARIAIENVRIDDLGDNGRDTITLSLPVIIILPDAVTGVSRSREASQRPKKVVLPILAEELTLGRSQKSPTSIGADTFLLHGDIRVLARPILETISPFLRSSAPYVVDSFDLEYADVVRAEGDRACKEANSSTKSRDVRALVTTDANRGLRATMSIDDRSLDVEYPFGARPLELRVSVYQKILHDPLIQALLAFVTVLISFLRWLWKRMDAP